MVQSTNTVMNEEENKLESIKQLWAGSFNHSSLSNLRIQECYQLYQRQHWDQSRVCVGPEETTGVSGSVAVVTHTNTGAVSQQIVSVRQHLSIPFVLIVNWQLMHVKWQFGSEVFGYTTTMFLFVFFKKNSFKIKSALISDGWKSFQANDCLNSIQFNSILFI